MTQQCGATDLEDMDKLVTGQPGVGNRRVSISCAMLENVADLKQSDQEGQVKEEDGDKVQRRQSVWPDIDAEDSDNPHAVKVYVKDIYTAYREQELVFAPKYDYMQFQKNLRPRYRTILVDWLGTTCYQLRLLKETYYLTVNILDRFLSKASIEKAHLQLIGIASLLIASKYEEIRHPTLESFTHACNQLYTETEIKEAEKRILFRLDYILTGATQFHFLSRYLKAAGLNVSSKRKLVCLIQYLVELTSLEYEFLQFNYSEIVVASIFIGFRAFGQQDALPYALQKHSGYTLADVLPCAKKVQAFWKNVQQDENIRFVPRLYKKQEYMRIAIAPIPGLKI